jgi:DNA polymerase-3 subunit delta'
MNTEIIGHSFQLYLLKKALEKERLSHAFLFSGPEKVGKKTVAFSFSSQILQTKELKNHPDFIFLEPKKEGIFLGVIGIDQIRELILRLSLKPLKAKKKVAIIDEAHLMTLEAQNSFLKTLEEPKGECVIFLITEHPQWLLPTITSRCQEIKFYLVSKEIMLQFLKDKKVDQKLAEKLVEISQGRPGRLIEYLIQEKLSKREEYILLLKKVPFLSLKERLDLAEKLSRDENLKEILIFWLEYVREILIKRLSDLQKTEKLKTFLKNLEELFLLLSRYSLNLNLALDNFFLKI